MFIRMRHNVGLLKEHVAFTFLRATRCLEEGKLLRQGGSVQRRALPYLMQVAGNFMYTKRKGPLFLELPRNINNIGLTCNCYMLGEMPRVRAGVCGLYVIMDRISIRNATVRVCDTPTAVAPPEGFGRRLHAVHPCVV